MKSLLFRAEMGLALALFISGCALGSVPEARLGDRIWQDLNSNGLQEQGEPGKEGVDVALHKEDGELVAATLSDEMGFFAFDQLRSGRYYLRVMVPEGWTFTEKDAGDDELDSDGDPLTGETDVFSFDSNATDLSRDAGLLAASGEASSTAIAVPQMTVEPTSTPDAFSEYREDEDLQSSIIVLIDMEPKESGLLRSNGSVMSDQLPEGVTISDRLLVFFADPDGNVVVGWIGDTAQGSLNVTGYQPGQQYPNWNFTRTLNPSGAAPAYEPEQVGPGDPGTCFGEAFALASTGVTAEQIQQLANISLWSYRTNEDGTFAYVHHLVDGVELETAAAILFGEQVVLETLAGPVLIGLPGSGLFDPKALAQSSEVQSSLEAHLGPLGTDGQGWLALGECLQGMAHAQ